VRRAAQFLQIRKGEKAQLSWVRGGAASFATANESGQPGRFTVASLLPACQESVLIAIISARQSAVPAFAAAAAPGYCARRAKPLCLVLTGLL